VIPTGASEPRSALTLADPLRLGIPLQQHRQGDPVPQPPHFRLVKRPLQLPRLQHRGKIEDRAKGRRDRDPVDHIPLVVRDGGFVSDDASPPRAATGWTGHFSPFVPKRHQLPKPRRRAMAEACAGARRQNRRHPPTLPADAPVANRVDAAVPLMQLPTLDPSLDRRFTHPHPPELPPTYHPMLPFRQFANRSLPRTSRQFPLYMNGKCRLDFHAADGALAGRVCGAQFVPIACRLTRGFVEAWRW